MAIVLLTQHRDLWRQSLWRQPLEHHYHVATAMLSPMSKLGAMNYGAEPCYLGPVGHGAVPKGHVP